MKLYLSSTDYPELREIRSFRQRQLIWLRACWSGRSDVRLCLLLGGGAILIGTFGIVLLAIWSFLGSPGSLSIAFLLIWCGGSVALSASMVLTTGARLIRPHLRRVCMECRLACPHCGYLLAGLIVDDPASVTCPECGSTVERSSWQEPFRLPG